MTLLTSVVVDVVQAVVEIGGINVPRLHYLICRSTHLNHNIVGKINMVPILLVNLLQCANNIQENKNDAAHMVVSVNYKVLIL